MTISPSVPEITLSVVSHGQNALVNALCEDLAQICSVALRLVLVENCPDVVPLAPGEWRNRVQILSNAHPRGFAANHNLAFSLCRAPYFCVCNPDIRLKSDPFPALLRALAAPSASVAGPLVRNAAGEPEDSARRFPTPVSLLRKFVSGRPGPDYPIDAGPVGVDWIAGMFMLFRSERFREAGGFDERYFLYYEDVDLCRRLRERGMEVTFEPRAEVFHDGQRGSRRSISLMRHHIASAARFLSSTGSR